ncbi:MAG: tetratricopeptide repeat protein [Proteobacteria bacterium]|nr:tetratricopeptide repeat protein [Pseudomonadota bacterium]
MADAPGSGTQIGSWTLREELGHGGMGTVWRGTNAAGEEAAIKLLHPHLTRSHAQLRRFEREAELGRKLTHPNLVPTIDSGERHGIPWIAMELVSGPTLFDLAVREGPLDETRVCRLLADVADALADLHDHGIIHRDVKPQNLVYDEKTDRARLMDLGIARAEEFSTLTATGQFIGSTRYAAPEQFHPGSDPIDGRADLYGLGVVLYELLTGQMAFPGLGVPALYVTKMRDGVPNPSIVRPDLSAPADALVRVLTSNDPNHRPEDARAAAHALRTGQVVELAKDSSIITLTGWDELPPSSAPEPPDAAIGRNALTGRLADQIREGQLLTLSGTAGSGKTRLAIELARMTRPRWLGGTIWVEAERATTAQALATEVAAALGLSPVGNDPITHVMHALRNREASLIVLDNLEQVVDVHTALTPWMGAGEQGVAWLVTSRTTTGCADEIVAEVDPLTLPAVGATGVAAIRESPAVELFLRRAREADRGFALTPEVAADVGMLVRKLDGLPLAIELAAARVAVISPRRMIERLDRRFRLLRDRGVKGRHSALRAALDASWELLEPWEQAALAWSGVFAGSFDADDCEAVWPIWDLFPDGEDPLDILQSLLSHHLLKREAGDGEVRFSLLQSIREYARNRLDDDGSVESPEGPATGAAMRETLRDRLADHLGKSARVELKRWHQHDDPLALDRLSARMADLLAAAQSDHTHALFCAEAALTVIPRRGPLSAVNALEARLAAVEGTHAAATLLALAQCQLLSSRLDAAFATLSLVVEGGGEPALAALAARGLVQLNRGNPEPAVADLEQVLSLTEGATDQATLRHRTRALNHLGKVCIHTGKPDRAQQCFDQAIDHLSRVSPMLASAVHNNRGMLALRTGRIDDADRAFREALRIDRELGTRLGEGKVLTNLGIVAYHQGKPERAEELWLEALACHREVGNAESEASALGNLGQLALERGRKDSARTFVRQSIALKKTLGQPGAEAYGYINLAKIEVSERNFGAAIAACNRALTLTENAGHPRMRAEAMLVLSEAQVGTGGRDMALQTLDTACETALHASFPAVASAAASRRTEMFLDAGRLDDAQEALTVAEDHAGKGPERAMLLVAKGRYALATGDLNQAARALSEAEDVTVTMNMGPETAQRQGVQRLKNAIASSTVGTDE